MKNYSTYRCFFALFVGICFGLFQVETAFAQFPGPPQGGPGGMRMEQVESAKIAYITTLLDLSPAEAQKFWPVYNKYMDEHKTIMKARRFNGIEARMKLDDLSDPEIEKAIKTEMDIRQQLVDLDVRYLSEFRKLLPTRKVALLLGAEEGFKRELLKRIRRP